MIRKRTAVATKPSPKPAETMPLRMEVGRVRSPRARKRSPGRPTMKQADELRDSLLHAALDAFLTKGFEAASIEGIARAAKVAKITLYRQFANKENLFYEVTRHAQAQMRRSLESVVDYDAPVEEMLRSLILQLHQGMTNPNYLAVLRMAISESQRFPAVASAMLHDSDFLLEPVTSYLFHLKAVGCVEIDSPRDAAIQLSCLAGGGARYLMVRPSNLPSAREHWADSLCKLFFRAWNLKPAGMAKPASAPRTRKRAVQPASVE